MGNASSVLPGVRDSGGDVHPHGPLVFGMRRRHICFWSYPPPAWDPSPSPQLSPSISRPREGGGTEGRDCLFGRPPLDHHDPAQMPYRGIDRSGSWPWLLSAVTRPCALKYPAHVRGTALLLLRSGDWMAMARIQAHGPLCS